MAMNEPVKTRAEYIEREDSIQHERRYREKYTKMLEAAQRGDARRLVRLFRTIPAEEIENFLYQAAATGIRGRRPSPYPSANALGARVLRKAIEYGHANVVEAFLREISIDEERSIFVCANQSLSYPARQGQVALLRILLDAVQQDERTAFICGSQALLEAAQHGELEAVQLLLDEVPDRVQREAFIRKNFANRGCAERTALSMAARGGHQDVVELLNTYLAPEEGIWASVKAFFDRLTH